MNIRKALFALLLSILACNFSHAADKPKLTIDEFFNAVDFTAVKLSPDGKSVVIGVERADWNENIFRKDLWLYRDSGTLNPTDPGRARY